MAIVKCPVKVNFAVSGFVLSSHWISLAAVPVVVVVVIVVAIVVLDTVVQVSSR